MFCSNCGNAVSEDARFCSNCGYAITPNAVPPGSQQAAPQQPEYQQPASQQYNTYQSAPQQSNNFYQDTSQQTNSYQSAPQQPAVSYDSSAIKAGVNVVYPDGHNEIGDLYISSADLRFVRKSKAVRIAFGFVGSAIEDGEEVLRINISDIAFGQRTRIGLNSNVYQITLRNGAAYRICFNRPKNISVLDQIIRNR